MKKLSFYTYILCAVVLAIASLWFYPKWNKEHTEATISWDAAGYYWYLPSVFIYHDIKHQSFKDHILDKYAPTPNNDFQEAYLHSSGNYVMKYSSGIAIMESPFFLAGHLAAKTLGYPADGFSAPYQLAIQLGGLFIAILGLWFFRKFLLLFYDDIVVAITLLLLVIGSNYLNYAAIDTAMSHNWLFTLYVFLLLNTYYFYQRPSFRYAVRIGLLVGLATLTRPTDIISCLIPILWGLNQVSGAVLRQRLAFFVQYKAQLITAVVCAAVIIFIQPAYWKYATGSWIVYSYGDQSFSWRHPHVYRYAFDAWNGWLAYTPLMIFAWVSLFTFWKYGNNKVLMITFFLINYYIVSAWDIWWYGGRAMVQSYPVLFFIIAAFIQFLRQNAVIKSVSTPFLLLFVYINIWFTIQAHGGVGFYNGGQSTRAYYRHTIGRWSAPPDIEKLKDTDELYSGVPTGMQTLYTNNLEQDTTQSPLLAISGKKALYVDKQHQNSETLMLKATPSTLKKWIRVNAKFYTEHKEWDMWKMTQFLVRFNKGGERLKERMIRVQRFLNEREVKDLYIDVKVPQEDFDNISILLWNGDGDKELVMDDVSVATFNEQ